MDKQEGERLKNLEELQQKESKQQGFLKRFEIIDEGLDFISSQGDTNLSGNPRTAELYSNAIEPYIDQHLPITDPREECINISSDHPISLENLELFVKAYGPEEIASKIRTVI